MTINHELCSELLGPFLRGELDAERRREVGVHLASCEACGEELRALAALDAPVMQAIEPLSEMERARLHRDVWAAVRSRPQPARKTLGARLLPYLGTAAVLALFAVGAVTLSGGGDDESSGDSAQMESLDATEDRALDPADAETGGNGEDAGSSRENLGYDNGDTGFEEEDETLRADAEATEVAAGLLLAPTFDLGCGIGLGSP